MQSFAFLHSFSYSNNFGRHVIQLVLPLSKTGSAFEYVFDDFLNHFEFQVNSNLFEKKNVDFFVQKFSLMYQLILKAPLDENNEKKCKPIVEKMKKYFTNVSKNARLASFVDQKPLPAPKIYSEKKRAGRRFGKHKIVE